MWLRSVLTGKHENIDLHRGKRLLVAAGLIGVTIRPMCFLNSLAACRVELLKHNRIKTPRVYTHALYIRAQNGYSQRQGIPMSVVILYCII